MKALKKSIVACGVTLVMCVSLLLGTTFAWFTDSITNEGNRIQSGSLKIDAYAYDLGEGGVSVSIDGAPKDTYTFAADGQNLKTDTAPIISSTLAPGKSSAKLLNVSNAGSLTAKVKLDFEIVSETNNISDVLWFDFIGITVDGNTATAVTGEFTEREMSQLAELSEREFELAPEAGMWYVFVYGMKGAEAGNEYQGGEFELDVTILAKQAVEGAEYAKSVASSEALTEAISEGGNISLDGDMDINLTSYVDKDTSIDLNGHTLTKTSENSIISAEGASLVLENGTLDFTAPGSQTADIALRADSEIVVRNITARSTRSLIVVGGGLNAEGAKLTVENCNFYTTNSTAISSNASVSYAFELEITDTTIVADSTDNVNYQYDNCPVFLNVPGTLTMTRCEIVGQRQGVMVRCGTAVLTDCTITTTGQYANKTAFLNENWGSGNDVPMAALVIGNRHSTSYQHPASVALYNCTITSVSDLVPAIYIWGQSETNNATLIYDASTVIEGATRGGGNNTVNGTAVTDNKPLS